MLLAMLMFILDVQTSFRDRLQISLLILSEFMQIN